MSGKPSGECFWSGMLSAGIFAGYNPSPAVDAQWAKGITIYEVQLEPLFPEQPAFMPTTEGGEPMYPTGRWLVAGVSSDLFNHIPNREAVFAERRMFVDTDLYSTMIAVEEAANDAV